MLLEKEYFIWSYFIFILLMCDCKRVNTLLYVLNICSTVATVENNDSLHVFLSGLQLSQIVDTEVHFRSQSYRGGFEVRLKLYDEAFKRRASKETDDALRS